jgi:hypothetical protein
VDLRARAVLTERNPVLCERFLEIPNVVVVQRQRDVIRRRRR